MMDGAIFGAAVHLFGNGVRTAFAAVPGAGLWSGRSGLPCARRCLL